MLNNSVSIVPANTFIPAGIYICNDVLTPETDVSNKDVAVVAPPTTLIKLLFNIPAPSK